jgi:adenosylcobyric acid synthase
MIEPYLNVPCVGIIPYLRDVGLDEEDGVAMEDRRTAARVWRDEDETHHRRLRIGVVALPHMSNFTDFDALAAEPSVALAYVSRAGEVREADVVIVPGTKQTLYDLKWLEAEGFDKAIQKQAAGALTIGICGGMQMLGFDVRDSGGLEGGGRMRGLGLLPISTTLASEKITQRAEAELLVHELFGEKMLCSRASGYEIHLGETEYQTGAKPLLQVTRGDQRQAVIDGATNSDGRVIGTYLHGLFDDDEFRHSFLRAARAACHLAPPDSFAHVKGERESRFDRLAAHVRDAIDLNAIIGWLKLAQAARVDSTI